MKTAILQDKANKSRTFLIVDADSNPDGIPDILAYFYIGP
jgi:hypothetical protein